MQTLKLGCDKSAYFFYYECEQHFNVVMKELILILDDVEESYLCTMMHTQRPLH